METLLKNTGNMTEFGKSKLLSTKELNNLGYNLAIYPVTTQRLALKNVKRLKIFGRSFQNIFVGGQRNEISQMTC